MVTSDVHDDERYFGSRLREWRHNPCLMQPVTAFMFIIFGVFMLITLLLQAPTLLLGLLLSPILSRSAWYVQFLYPWDVARWAHFLLIRKTLKRSFRDDDKNRGFHSRTVEQKIEVIPGRVFIHPIPQWLDNLGYLVVCVPKPLEKQQHDVVITVADKSESIVALVIDCGEAPATMRIIELIQQYHYGRRRIEVQTILSTHKHHDHTGGNSEFMSSEMGKRITRVYAGAVERAPRCTHPIGNGDKLVLPKSGSNDMNELVEIEAVAVPAHTRGSLVYRLYSKESESEFMFTGDTMFSGGAGVPFEADIGTESESKLNQSHGNTFVRAGLGHAAMERCFAEILARGKPHAGNDEKVLQKILVFPGHEYTSELLARQFQGALNEACRWKNFAPRDFFDTVSHMYVALHRRSLPHNSGKLLLVPSTLSREIRISPHFRSLRRSGDLVIRAVTFWYDNFCLEKEDVQTLAISEEDVLLQRGEVKTATTTPRRWNVHPDEVGKTVFTTVYTNDLYSVIEDLMSECITRNEAAQRLKCATSRLDEHVVNKRAIPGFVPSDKSIYRGISGLVLLGSGPAAMSLSDSRTMKLPAPFDSSSDKIVISKKRLLVVLGRLGLLRNSNSKVSVIVGQLWKEAHEFMSGTTSISNGHIDLESNVVDEIELGILKWVIYGVPSKQPSWFSKILCMPCSSSRQELDFPEHPIMKMTKKMGDLVSHDVLTCELCRTASGCMQIRPSKEENKQEPKEKEGKVNNKVELPTREAHSFSSFADYARQTNAMEIMGGLTSLLKEHE